MNYDRVKKINSFEYSGGLILYWMNRDQRVNDNWALIFAQELSFKYKKPFAVLFSLSENDTRISSRQLKFMIENLKQVEENLKKKNIPFIFLLGNPAEVISNYIHLNNIGILISDFSPLRNDRLNKQKLLSKLKIPFYEVDAHNIVPVWIASDKMEIGAYTIRPKIHKHLNLYLEEYPKITKQTLSWDKNISKVNWQNLIKNLKINKFNENINWIRPGEKEALKVLNNFLKNKLMYYNERRNNPNLDGQSNLSPYLHFGQISSQRIALEIKKIETQSDYEKSFLEELIVRKELADNFCYYNKDYDSFNGFPRWAQETLNLHRYDKREYIYSLRQFENAETHDALWNAAQIELIEKGKMHGYMRMYWAKKILEWTKHPEDALNIAIKLNDKYELDGNDPNGYTGIAWSIGGVHDRAWGERKIFGKIRYMNYSGCKRKFNVLEYISKFTSKKQ